MFVAQGKALNPTQNSIDQDWMFHCGTRKRPRFVKGTTDTDVENVKGVKGPSFRGHADETSVRWPPAAESIGRALQVCASSTRETVSENVQGSITPVHVAHGRQGADSTVEVASTLFGIPDRQFTSTENPLKVSDFPGLAHGRIAKNGLSHRRPQLESLHGSLNLDVFRWPKVFVSLSHKEREDDFMAIKGSKLPQRPKGRLKHIEKSVLYVSPGTWLCGWTRDRYEVIEKKSLKKKPRGLKAMGCVDSDSE